MEGGVGDSLNRKKPIKWFFKSNVNHSFDALTRALISSCTNIESSLSIRSDTFSHCPFFS